MIALANAAGLQVRLMGGLSFHARCPSWTARIDRDGRDIDLATRGKDRKGVTALMEGSGYAADRQYNALYGHKQMYFVDPARRRPVDVLIDRMEMSHKFEFAGRLAVDNPTLPLAEMLLTKVQIAQINRKDILDGLALLSEYPLGNGDDGTINLDRITSTHLERLGLVADLHRQPRQVRGVLHDQPPAGRARVRAASRGSRRWPRSARSAARSTPRASHRAGSSGPGSVSGSSGTTSPRRSGTAANAG